jgi:hypothetical protein
VFCQLADVIEAFNTPTFSFTDEVFDQDVTVGLYERMVFKWSSCIDRTSIQINPFRFKCSKDERNTFSASLYGIACFWCYATPARMLLPVSPRPTHDGLPMIPRAVI